MGKKNNPLVSVIIPVYNGEEYLAEAIESALAQTYRPIEIIVVDDGSTDRTASIARSFKDITYTFQSNRGPSSARNTGIGMAQGDFIAFLDADDYWPENKLNTQMSHFIENPETEVVLGRIQFIGLFTDADRSIRFEGPDNTMISVNLGSGLFRKAVFDKVGIFDETLRYYEDHDWFLRVREQGISMVILKLITLYYRRHEFSLSRRKQKTDPTMFQILKKSLDRRRCENRGYAPLLRHFFDHDEGKASSKKSEES